MNGPLRLLAVIVGAALLFALLLHVTGCTGFGSRHLVDSVPHREPPEWMYSEPPDEIEVTLIDGTTYFQGRR